MSSRCLTWAVVGIVVAAQVPARAQEPAFEVASVKANRSGELRIDINTPAPDRFTATNVPLRELIRFAYDVQNVRLLGGPDWIRSERFDIVAKADRDLPAWGPSGPPIEILRRVRTLLADRFGLIVHRETRDLPVYALVVARQDRRLGPELRPTTLDCATTGGQTPTCTMRIAPGSMVMRSTPMSQFATILAPFVQRVVIDRTLLTGGFDFGLSWTPQQGPAAPADLTGASIFAALQEQLGLKLEPQQAPLDVVVIDRVERPTPD